MNVLFLTHRLPYAPNRGDRIRAYHLLEEMSRHADVSLFSLVHSDDEAGYAAGVPFARAVATSRVPRLRNLARAGTHLFSQRPLTHSLLDAADIPDQLTQLVHDQRPDVVLAYCSGMARFALEPPLAGIPFVLDMVDVDSAKWDALAHRSSGPRKWVYRREARTLRAFEAAVTARARTTLVVNERERFALLGTAPAARVRVVENGIDVDAFRSPARAIRTASVVFCGVLNYEPNEAGVLWFLKHVWARVRVAHPEARFRIVGAHPTRAIRQAAEAEDSVDLIGHVPAVQPHLWTASVSVAPLHLARGLQNKVLEALAAGLPVVTTSTVLEGLPPQARAGCIDADTPDAYARGVVELLARSEIERTMMAASAQVERLTWRERLHDLDGILSTAAGLQ